MRVLITGGTGFVGSHLAPRLIKRGYDVRVLARKETPKTDYLKKLGIEICLGDITDKSSVNKVVKDIDLIYHLAAILREIAVPDKVLWEVHVDGTKNILDAALQENVERFIHCSTVGVLGDIENPPADESAPYNPGDSYQKTKCEGEKLASKHFNETGLAGVVVRPCGIYGPGDTRLLRLFKAICHKKFIMIGKGDVFYQLTYIDDLIDAFELCGQKKEALGEIYIIAGNESPTLNELVEVIAKAVDVPVPRKRFPFFWPVWLASWICEAVCKPLGVEPPLFRRRVDFFRKNRAFDISKARKELGFEPKIDLETGIKITADWYKRQGWL